MGIITGLALFMLVVIMIMALLKNTLHKLFIKICHYFLTRNDRARAIRVKKLNTATGTRNNILFRLLITQDGELNDMIMKSRMALRKEITGDEPIYEEICQKPYEANKFSRDLEEKIRGNPHHRMGYNAAKAAVITTLVLAASAPTQTYACDTTLYLSSNGKVCDIKGCQDTNAYSMQIQTGSKLCFNTADGERLEVKIKDSKSVTRYQASYYACSYEITTDSYWECKSPASWCWNQGTCKDGSSHSELNKTVMANNKRSDLYPHGYGCHSDTIGCDTMCWHETSCTWYRWEVHPKDRACHKVYQKTSEVWQTSVFVSYKGLSKHIKLNTNNPTYNLNALNTTGIMNLPMAMSSFSHEKIHLRNSIVIIDGESYAVDSSQQNFPIKNKVGEMQMSLDQQTFVYYTSSPECRPESCSTKCIYDTPAMERVTRTKSMLISKGQVLKNGEMILKRQIPVQATATLTIGNIQLDHLYTSPSHCKINVEQSYACTGCEEKPKVIFKAYDIKSEGLLEFESNCSWVQKVLSCNPEPYILSLSSNEDYCQIYIPSTNQTLSVSLNYIFVGQLEMLKTYYSESSADILESLMTDKNFWTGLLSSLNFMALISVSSVAVLKLIRLGVAYKTEKVVEKV